MRSLALAKHGGKRHVDHLMGMMSNCEAHIRVVAITKSPIPNGHEPYGASRTVEE